MRADATSTKFCSTTDSSSDNEVGCGLTDLSISFCFSDQDFRVFSNTCQKKTKYVPESERRKERERRGGPNRERERENVRETEKAHQAEAFGQLNTPTLSLVNIWALFLWTMWMYPGGCIQASPSTWAGTASSPIMVIFTRRHYRQKWGLFFQTQKALIHTCVMRLVAYRQM